MSHFSFTEKELSSSICWAQQSNNFSCMTMRRINFWHGMLDSFVCAVLEFSSVDSVWMHLEMIQLIWKMYNNCWLCHQCWKLLQFWKQIGTLYQWLNTICNTWHMETWPLTQLSKTKRDVSWALSKLLTWAPCTSIKAKKEHSLCGLT